MKKAYKIRQIAALTVFLLCVAGFFGVYPLKVIDVQFGTLLQRTFVDFSVIAIVLLLVITGVTFVCGRFYCSVICPFGFLQELAALIFKRKNKDKAVKNLPVKYFIAAVTFGVLGGGSAVVLRFLEPYTLFGSSITASAFGLVALFAVLSIVFFKNRFFCTNICPVGAILGIISKISLKKININKEKCVSCGMCERNCSSGCINSKEKFVDNETCVKCLKCLQVCPKGAINFGKALKAEEKFSLKRRQLIIGAAAIAVFGGMIKAGIVLKDKIAEKLKDIILPAGAESKERFANKCYNCNLCVQNCPNKILEKGNEDFPVVHIDYSKGKKLCNFDCVECGKVCPTGAIKRLSLEEKQKTRIAMAMINSEKCHNCGACVAACPKGAIINVEGTGIVLNAQKCIGCGACKSVCWHDAIEIFSIKEQKLI